MTFIFRATLVLATLISFQSKAWDFSDFKTEFTSPVTTKAAIPFYVGLGLTALAVIFEDSVVDPLQEEAVDHKPLGSFSKIGDISSQVVPNALYFIGYGAAGYFGNEDGYRRAAGMFKATAYASLVTTTLKYTVREKRPNQGNERNSFPSGHTTTAFAFAGYVLGEHGWAWGIPALGLASFTGFSRINDNRHYLHDVLGGMAIGLVTVWVLVILIRIKEVVPFQCYRSIKMECTVAFLR